MITISVFVFLLLVVLAAIFKATDDIVDAAMGSFIALVGAFVVFALVAYPMIRTFEGLMPTYSEGAREGYLTKVSTKGVIFKTNEAQLQIGTGQMAALQEPWLFSIPDEKLNRIARSMMGEKVRIHYNEWLIGPLRLGETNYIAESIEPLE